MNKGIVKILLLVGIVACSPPVRHYSREVGDPYFEDAKNVGSNTGLDAPAEIVITNIINNFTTTDEFLHVTWQAVAGATQYNIYAACYPTWIMWEDEDYFVRKSVSVYKKVGETRGTEWNFKIPFTPENETIKRPLRGYVLCVSAQNGKGESLLSPLVRGARKPKNAIEALKDMDYNMHYSMCHTKDFGEPLRPTTYTQGRTDAYPKYKGQGGVLFIILFLLPKALLSTASILWSNLMGIRNRAQRMYQR